MQLQKHQFLCLEFSFSVTVDVIFFEKKKTTSKQTNKILQRTNKQTKEKNRKQEATAWNTKLDTTWGNRKQEILKEINSDQYTSRRLLIPYYTLIRTVQIPRF